MIVHTSFNEKNGYVKGRPWQGLWTLYANVESETLADVDLACRLKTFIKKFIYLGLKIFDVMKSQFSFRKLIRLTLIYPVTIFLIDYFNSKKSNILSFLVTLFTFLILPLMFQNTIFDTVDVLSALAIVIVALLVIYRWGEYLMDSSYFAIGVLLIVNYLPYFAILKLFELPHFGWYFRFLSYPFTGWFITALCYTLIRTLLEHLINDRAIKQFIFLCAPVNRNFGESTDKIHEDSSVKFLEYHPKLLNKSIEIKDFLTTGSASHCEIWSIYDCEKASGYSRPHTTDYIYYKSSKSNISYHYNTIWLD